MNIRLASFHTRLASAVLVVALALTAVVATTSDQAEALDPGVDVVYVADGRSFADALVGAVVAAMNNTSVLTVAGTDSGDFVPDATQDELTRLQPARIVILGGTAAVSDAVETELGTYTTPTAGNTERLFGTDRFGTAAAISEALPNAIQRALFAEEAGDADTLDGNDASDFLGAGDQATDSDLLDGMDSSDFVQTGDSIDADTLDGSDASDFAPDGHDHFIRSRATAPGDADIGISNGSWGKVAELSNTSTLPDRCGGDTAQWNVLLTATATVESASAGLAQIGLRTGGSGDPIDVSVRKATIPSGTDFLTLSTELLTVLDEGEQDFEFLAQTNSDFHELHAGSLVIRALGYSCPVL